MDTTFALTVFAPVNAAFDALPAGLVNVLFGHADAWYYHWQSLLLFHMVSESISASEMTPGQIIEMLSGDSLELDLDFGVSIDDGTSSKSIIVIDIAAANGYLHLLSGVLEPSWFSEELDDTINALPSTSTMKLLIDSVDGLEDELRGYGDSGEGFTFFSPVNAAISGPVVSGYSNQERTDFILNHLVVGVWAYDRLAAAGPRSFNAVGGAIIQVDIGAIIVNADFPAVNGILHTISTQLYTP